MKRRRRPRKGVTKKWEAKVAKVAKKAIMNVAETKYHNVDIDLTSAFDGNSVIQFLTGIPREIDDRVGDDINLQHIQFRLTATADATPVADQLFRLILVQVNECDGALPDVNTILQSDDMYDFRHEENNGNFRILWDKTFRLRKPGLQTVLPRMYITKFKKLNARKRTTYTSASALITGAQRNHLFLIGMNLEATGEQPEVLGKCRIAYKDI